MCLLCRGCKKGTCFVILVVQILTTVRLLRFELLASLAIALFISPSNPEFLFSKFSLLFFNQIFFNQIFFNQIFFNQIFFDQIFFNQIFFNQIFFNQTSLAVVEESGADARRTARKNRSNLSVVRILTSRATKQTCRFIQQPYWCWRQSLRQYPPADPYRTHNPSPEVSH